MFLATKLVSLALAPTALMVELALVGLLLWRRWIVALAVALLASCMLLPISTWAGRPLENRFPQAEPPAHVDGIILLGGAIDDLTSQDHQVATLNAAANRITTFVSLARKYPDAKLVLTGGSGDLQQGDATETPWALKEFAALGLDVGRVMSEATSRTTWENAIEVNRLVRPKPTETWVLLTSAIHMPRAVGVFRAAGWKVLPWPVGYRTRNHLDTWVPGLSNAFPILDLAAHEWTGLLAYWLQGHSSALFPAPEPNGGQQARVSDRTSAPPPSAND